MSQEPLATEGSERALNAIENALSIPHYAFGDNEAACLMRAALEIAAEALRSLPSESGGKSIASEMHGTGTDPVGAWPSCAPSAEREKLADKIAQTTAHTDFEPFLNDAEWCEIVKALRGSAPSSERRTIIEECAAIAEAHKGQAARDRRAKKILQSDEIQAEERGEDIAAEIIARSIRALKGEPVLRGPTRAELDAAASSVPPAAGVAMANRADRQHMLDMVRNIRKRIKESPGGPFGAPFSDDGWRIIEGALTDTGTASATGRTDSARIDWLEKWHTFGDHRAYGDCGLNLIHRNSDGWAIDSDLGKGQFDTLREAIDAAISATDRRTDG